MKGKSKLLVISILILVSLIDVTNTLGKTLRIFGYVRTEGSAIENVKVTFSRVSNSKELFTCFTSKRGLFEYTASFQDEILITFSKDNYVTKKIIMSTVMPSDRLLDYIFPYRFDVELLKQLGGVSLVFFEKEVARIAYSPKIDDFDYDTDYAMRTIRNLVESLSKEDTVEQVRADSSIQNMEVEVESNIDSSITILNGDTLTKMEIIQAILSHDTVRLDLWFAKYEIKNVHFEEASELPTRDEFEDFLIVLYSKGRKRKVIKEPSRTITRIIIIENSRLTIFTRIEYKWGGLYFFKENETITQTVYDLETNPVHWVRE